MTDKKILYVDMDGVIACFYTGCMSIDPNVEWEEEPVNRLVEANPRVFRNLPIIEGAKEAIQELKELYEIYFLSTPMWSVPESYTDKRLWLHDHYGDWAEHRLILSKHKHLHIGHYIVDDRTVNGIEKFQGKHLHFATPKFPNWDSVTQFLKKPENHLHFPTKKEVYTDYEK